MSVFCSFSLFAVLFCWIGFAAGFADIITTAGRISFILRFLLTISGFSVIICLSREIVVLSSASVLRL